MSENNLGARGPATATALAVSPTIQSVYINGNNV